ncbi:MULTISPECIES: flagellar hook-associated protein FlgL [unclassified Pseudomonas]|uniref:flagellar hook-associated protein FlgL n=1 Tax=unclassified Pseudomonas TaxID=196821 RepID=UPI00129E2731|nr:MULTISPECIES: flagellar hook-associated protein FlgL [unclassified Pseudomonas]MDH4656356.1 flagellar hook-associated protein FlgL [Pseudomonas sp. BN606]MRK19552.1 flagellar hook-associated protein FlgL [Pseudomonas sp. JG-B]
MRISTIQQYNNGVSGLQRNYANVTRTQEQISTGNRILTPADDPVASVRLLQLDQQQGVLDQYASNLTAAKNSLTQEEVTLNSVNTVLQRVRELAGEAGNGALSAEDRRSIAAELEEREDELLSLMNTRNSRGEYLFAGFQGKTQPFVRNADGSYSYEGDEGQRKLQIASSLQLAISDNGKRVFQNVINAGRLDSTLTTSPAGSTLTPSAALVQDEVSFSGTPPFPDAGVQIVFGNPNASSYEIFELGTTTPVLASGAIDADVSTSDQVVFRGVNIKFDGLAVGGETLEITPQPNRQKQGILDTIATLRRALESTPDTPTGNRQVRDSVAEALLNLDNGITVVDSVRGDIGARLNVMESTQTDNEDVTLVNQAVQAELRELDYAEALSRLSFQSIILEAAQQSYMKISSLNLFNQMR